MSFFENHPKKSLPYDIQYELKKGAQLFISPPSQGAGAANVLAGGVVGGLSALGGGLYLNSLIQQNIATLDSQEAEIVALLALVATLQDQISSTTDTVNQCSMIPPPSSG